MKTYTFTFPDLGRKFVIKQDDINEWYTVYEKKFLRRMIAIESNVPLESIEDAIYHMKKYIWGKQ